MTQTVTRAQAERITTQMMQGTLTILADDVARWGSADHARWRDALPTGVRNVVIAFQCAVERRRGAVH